MFYFNHRKWQAILDDPSIDGAIWTYKLNSTLTKEPTAFAYCVVGDDGATVEQLVEKKTISDTPHKDPLVVGSFWFRRASDFIHAAKEAIETKLTVNNEFYVGTSLNILFAEGKKFVTFPIDQWISFGDPFELQVFEYWEDFFRDRPGQPAL